MSSKRSDHELARVKRAALLYRRWRREGVTQSTIASEVGKSRVWVNRELRWYSTETSEGRRARKRYDAIEVRKRDEAVSKSDINKARTAGRYRLAALDVINGMTVKEVAHKYGRSYQTMIRGLKMLSDTDPQLYQEYVKANRSHRFGWNRRKNGDNENDEARDAE